MRHVFSHGLDPKATLLKTRLAARKQTPAIVQERQFLKATGVFRRDIDVVDPYQLIVSLGFFNVGNRYTFGESFKRKSCDASPVRKFVVDAVLRYVTVQPQRIVASLKRRTST